MNYLEGQIEVTKAHVAYWQTLILSGAYKTRAIYRRENGKDILLTEAELLKDATDCMNRHVQRLYELAENLPSGEKSTLSWPR